MWRSELSFRVNECMWCVKLIRKTNKKMKKLRSQQTGNGTTTSWQHLTFNYKYCQFLNYVELIWVIQFSFLSFYFSMQAKCVHFISFHPVVDILLTTRFRFTVLCEPILLVDKTLVEKIGQTSSKPIFRFAVWFYFSTVMLDCVFNIRVVIVRTHCFSGWVNNNKNHVDFCTKKNKINK